jgi:hypothetical protein
MLTKLSSILFDLESDIASIKMDFYPLKLNTSETISYLPEKYWIEGSGSSYSNMLSQLNIFIKDSPIPSLAIGFTGDVYVNNYKRGKIQISDIYEEYTTDGRDYGSSKIKVNDGTVTETDSGFIYINYCYNSIENLPWINSNNEIVSWANQFCLYPTGITDYDLANYAVSALDDFYNFFNNKYTMFPTVTHQLNGDQLIIEENVFHFSADTNLITNLSPTDEENYYDARIMTMLGTKITKVGILISEDPNNFEDDAVTITLDSGLYWARTFAENNSSMETYLFTYSNLKESLRDFDINASRVYYVPYLEYEKFAYSDDDYWYYYSTPCYFYSGTVKYIDLD